MSIKTNVLRASAIILMSLVALPSNAGIEKAEMQKQPPKRSNLYMKMIPEIEQEYEAVIVDREEIIAAVAEEMRQDMQSLKTKRRFSIR